MSKSIEVSFEETQQREHLAQRVVLVLDVSQSMDVSGCCLQEIMFVQRVGLDDENTT